MKRAVLMVVLPLLFDAAVGCALALDAQPGVMQSSAAQKPAARVFFYWDDSSVSPHARQALADIARAQPGHQPVRIVADSVADRLQGASYAALLNQRRLESIVAELVRDGLPAERIAVSAATREVIVGGEMRLAGK